MEKMNSPERKALVPSWHGVYPREMFENAFVIGLAGFAGAGKTTIAEQIINELKQDNPSLPVLRLSFASRLKEVLATLVGENMTFTRPEDKTALLYAGSDWRVRDFLTTFATEFVRDQIGADFWVDVMAKNLVELEQPTVVIIDDLRFPNELKLVQSLGEAILIKRTGNKNTIQHRSEEPEKLTIETHIKNNDSPQRAAWAILEIAQKDQHWLVA